MKHFPFTIRNQQILFWVAGAHQTFTFASYVILLNKISFLRPI